jgi:GTPase
MEHIPLLEYNKYDEITINIVGNVDSGKSSLCGILSHNKLLDKLDVIDKEQLNTNILDDGNGKSRQRVLSLKHEQLSGRTSSISYNYLLLQKSEPRPKIISLIDLAGHSRYLKTTIKGVISTYPEYGFILIAKNITQMTREHYAILTTLGIPILFIFTKIDMIPNKIIESNINSIKILSKKYKKSLNLYNPNDLPSFSKNENLPSFSKNDNYIKLSNKTGDGFDLLLHFLNNIKKKEKKILNAFCIDNTYHNITGFGTVVAGINGININKGDDLVMGPFINKTFIPVKIRSIHNDYKQFIDNIGINVRGCLCIKYDPSYKKYIKSGIIITRPELINVNTKIQEYSINLIEPINKFEACIAIFRGNGSNIKVGYTSYINIGLNSGCITITKIRDKDTNKEIPSISSKYAIVEMEFKNKYVCINKNDKFLFRTDIVNGIGKVLNIII